MSLLSDRAAAFQLLHDQFSSDGEEARVPLPLRNRRSLEERTIAERLPYVQRSRRAQQPQRDDTHSSVRRAIWHAVCNSPAFESSLRPRVRDARNYQIALRFHGYQRGQQQ